MKEKSKYESFRNQRKSKYESFRPIVCNRLHRYYRNTSTGTVQQNHTEMKYEMIIIIIMKISEVSELILYNIIFYISVNLL